MKFNRVDAAFAFGFIEKGIVHISARGGKKVNVGKIMENMNGGGNKQSAGGRIESDDLEAIKEALIKIVPLGLMTEEEIKEEPSIVKVKQLKR